MDLSEDAHMYVNERLVRLWLIIVYLVHGSVTSLVHVYSRKEDEFPSFDFDVIVW